MKSDYGSLPSDPQTDARPEFLPKSLRPIDLRPSPVMPVAHSRVPAASPVSFPTIEHSADPPPDPSARPIRRHHAAFLAALRADASVHVQSPGVPFHWSPRGARIPAVSDVH